MFLERSSSKFIALVLALAIACGAVAQNKQTGGESSTQFSDWLTTTINAQSAKRSPDSAQPAPLDKYAFKIVFLVNTAQATWKSAYAEFVMAGIRRFLNSRYEAGKSYPRERQTEVALYPYQQELYSRSPICVPLSPLSEDTIAEFDRHPLTTILKGADGTADYKTTMGSNNAGARADLLKLLGNPQGDKPVIVVQLTANPLNECPADPALDAKIRPISGQFGALDGTDYVAYDVPGEPFQTNRPSPGVEPYDVYAWVYGPKTLEYSRLWPVASKPVAPTQPAQKQPANPIPIVPIVVGVVVVLGLAAIALLLKNRGGTGGRNIRITIMPSTEFVLKPGESYAVYGQKGDSKETNVIRLSRPNTEGKLFSIKYSKSSVEIQNGLWVMTLTDAPGSPCEVPLGQRCDLTAKRQNGDTEKVTLEVVAL